TFLFPTMRNPRFFRTLHTFSSCLVSECGASSRNSTTSKYRVLPSWMLARLNVLSATATIARRPFENLSFPKVLEPHKTSRLARKMLTFVNVLHPVFSLFSAQTPPYYTHRQRRQPRPHTSNPGAACPASAAFES